jgi:hypothetical protein
VTLDSTLMRTMLGMSGPGGEASQPAKPG